jgi:transcription initiation factor TFIID subunit 5
VGGTAQEGEQQPASLHSTFAEYKKDKQIGGQPPADEAIPLPPKLNRDVITELDRLADLRSRVKLSAQQQPSAVTYTFHNTYDSLNTLALSDDGRICAGGFAESYIKVWSMSPDENLRSLKANTELSVMDFENGNNYFKFDYEN